MGNPLFNRRRFWFVTLCIAIVILSLAAHLIADATCRSPELAKASQCGASKDRNLVVAGQMTTCSLAAGSMLPQIISIYGMMTVTFMLIGARLVPSFWSPSPPVHPPIALH